MIILPLEALFYNLFRDIYYNIICLISSQVSITIAMNNNMQID